MVEVTWAGIVASAARGGEACDKIRVLSRSQSRLPHSEHFCNLAKARLLRHLSRRFAVVDSCPEARGRAGLQEESNCPQIVFAHSLCSGV